MAKRRDRRVAGDSGGHRNHPSADLSFRQNRVNPSTPQRQSKQRKFIFSFLLFFVASAAISVAVYSIKYVPRTDRTLSYVHQQGLVKPDVNSEEILTEHEEIPENVTYRHYTYPVLAYITPWNSKGYDLAKRFNSKFTHLSPVWYDLKSQGMSLVLEGRHNADIGWISEVKVKGGAKVVPRIVLEAIPKELLTKKKLKDKAINLIVTECREMGYDGIVLESWSRWAAYGILHDPDTRNMALQFIKQLGQKLHSESSQRDGKRHLELIYVIGPPHSERLQWYDFGPEDLRALRDAVDGFSLMTYDFSSPQNPGPNAPLKWMHSTLELLLGRNSGSARKIFLGINFYGNDFILAEDSGGGAITGRDYLSLLEKHRPVMQWEKNSGEHFFFYTDNNHLKHVVFYPTLLSISMRLEEAHAWGAGISIWEIGQGLDYFFDLL